MPTWEDFAERPDAVRDPDDRRRGVLPSNLRRGTDALELGVPADRRAIVPPPTTVVPSDDPLFPAIVHERLHAVICAFPRMPRCSATIGIMAGPLIDQHASGRVIGMFAIGGASLDDMPEDVERRFLLTSSEIAGLVGRIGFDRPAGTPPPRPPGPVETDMGRSVPRRSPSPAPALSCRISAGSRAEVKRAGAARQRLHRPMTLYSAMTFTPP